jgi:hypothetical protein
MIKIKYNSPNYIISGINVNTFYNDILKTFKTSKINKIYKSSFGLFGKKLIVHEFFLPELNIDKNHITILYLYQK